MKKTVSLIVLLTLAAWTQGHEFWLQPQKYRFAVGETAVVDFKVGENFTGEYWDMKRHQVVEMKLYTAGTPVSLLTSVKKSEGKNLSHTFTKSGTHLFFLQSNAAYIELEGVKFTDYLTEDGLDEIIDLRSQRQQTESKAREFYTRYSKLLLQSGSDLSPVVTQPVGALHEIVPLQNPYALKVGDYLTIKVMYGGKPRPHALVKIWTKRDKTTFLQNLYTENDGTLKFPINAAGEWMVSTVKMVPSVKTGADYESAWASLVFGIES